MTRNNGSGAGTNIIVQFSVLTDIIRILRKIILFKGHIDLASPEQNKYAVLMNGHFGAMDY